MTELNTHQRQIIQHIVERPALAQIPFVTDTLAAATSRPEKFGSRQGVWEIEFRRYMNEAVGGRNKQVDQQRVGGAADGSGQRSSADQWSIRVDQAYRIRVRFPGDKRWYEYERRHVPNIPFSVAYREWEWIEVTPHRFPARLWFEALNFGDSSKYGIGAVAPNINTNHGTKESAAFDFNLDEAKSLIINFDPFQARDTADMDGPGFVAPGPPFGPVAVADASRSMNIDRRPTKIIIDTADANGQSTFFRINSAEAQDFIELEPGDGEEYNDHQIDSIEFQNRGAAGFNRISIRVW